MEWYEITALIVGLTLPWIWYKPKPKSKPDEHIEWSGDNICFKRKQYPDIEYKLEPKEEDETLSTSTKSNN